MNSDILILVYDNSLLSNERLLHDIIIILQAIASLRLYWQQSIIRKICNALLGSILNQISALKHLKITVGEYTYGLPYFPLGILGHGIHRIRYRMLSMDSFNLSRFYLWDSINQNHISRIIFNQYDCVENGFELKPI